LAWALLLLVILWAIVVREDAYFGSFDETPLILTGVGIVVFSALIRATSWWGDKRHDSTEITAQNEETQSVSWSAVLGPVSDRGIGVGFSAHF
jgi:hypothetical protein